MQLIEGTTLTKAFPTMALEQRVGVMKQVAEALHEAHRAGLIHRDIKPENVLVESSEAGPRPYVTDFGLVHDANAQATTTGAIVGTPSYMSPEQARGESMLDRRSDVFSLG
jgi:serine/threonine protein kinase